MKSYLSYENEYSIYGISPGLPMYEQSRDSCLTKATLTEGRIILNKDTTPTETTVQALGINTDIT
ncbi:hypothetical protein [Rodentibacter genomosp. 2]|uniref:Uncharacterized protein n=1 Tax=Rodentibacter genomosp. 2 TaxID=1908266 RepID=A0A1V3JD36_9PAST|nr:hypothetical protein [Rodentibacter genomosp. 2]OOF54593.1 hypothetical protein BKK55_08910 [Rodentibacter genomosp. 2]